MYEMIATQDEDIQDATNIETNGKAMTIPLASILIFIDEMMTTQLISLTQLDRLLSLKTQ